MLKILHKGIQVSVDITPSKMDLDPVAFQTDAYVLSLKAGRVVAVTPTGAVLADGAAAANLSPFGFLINDAAGYFYENKPALASGKLGVAFGDCVVATDQIDSTETFVVGDLLYVGTGSKAGLVTKTAPTGARVIGIALSAASASSPELTIAVR